MKGGNIMEKLPAYLKHGDKDSIVYSGEGYMKFFIPEKYFDREYCEIDGDIIKVIGIFTYAIYDKNDKPIGGLKNMLYPNVFWTRPSESVKETGIKLTKNNDVSDYRVLKYYNGDTVILSTKVPKVVGNVELFFKMLTSGVIPNNIPYDDIVNMVFDNATMNGYNYQVPASLAGVIVGKLCRSRSDIYTPYRLSGSNDQNNYTMVSIKDIPKFTSAFTSVTSENWDESIANALVNKSNTYSPLEKLFMGD